MQRRRVDADGRRTRGREDPGDRSTIVQVMHDDADVGGWIA
jgi:hypothetical protein